MNMLTITVPAPDRHRYAPDAFAPSIGERIPFEDGEAILMAARVADDGRSVELDLDVPHLPSILERLI